MSRKMRTRKQYPAIFAQLLPLLERHSPPLVVVIDTPVAYCLASPPSPSFQKPFVVARVLLKKTYISYHLMPVYMHPNLLEGLSDSLRRRMQGTSCFNFTAQLGEPLLAELDDLTERAIARLLWEYPQGASTHEEVPKKTW